MITATLATYIAGSGRRALPGPVREAAVLHLVDTVAAMVSGSTLEARGAAIAFVGALSGRPDCTIAGLDLLACADCAALANGMFAHADEFDDSHGASVTHPGCSAIPAALAGAERQGASGETFLRAVVTGYDTGTRVAAALGGGRFMEHYHHVSFGGIFGAAASAAAAMGQDATAAAGTLTFAVHLAAGSTCWMRDPAHVEKGLVFAGLPAQNGVRAALMGQAGIRASTEPLEGVPGLFAGYPETSSRIEGPKDLEGKKVGVRAYSVTTGVWTRGILVNEFDVDSSKVTWVVDDEEHVAALKLPANVTHAPDGKSLASMMAEGELQAGFLANAGIGRAGPPTEGWSASVAPVHHYNELFPDADELGAEWYRRTGIYPMHSTLVIKDEILEAHPDVAPKIYDAFVKAKQIYLDRLHAGEAKGKEDEKRLKLMKVVGPDPLPYGIEVNRPAIDALKLYAVQQGLMPKDMPVSELFIDADRF